MECQLCNCSIITNTTTTTIGVKYGLEKLDGKWYCTECAEVADFASDIMSVSEKRIIPTKSIPIAVIQAKTTSVIYFYCFRCNEQASGMKCEMCGNPNPIFIRKKHTKRNK